MKNARRKKKIAPRAAAAPKRPKAAPITNLTAIQGMCDQYIDVDFDYDGTPIRLKVRRLRPVEQHKLDLLRAPVVPPIIRGKTMEEDRPDLNDTNYRMAKATMEHTCRNLTIYWCCPAFHTLEEGGRPNLTDQQEIVDFVDGFFSHDILTLLADVAKSNPMSMGELVNLS